MSFILLLAIITPMRKIQVITAVVVIFYSSKINAQLNLEFNIGSSFTNVVSGSGGFFTTQEEFSTGLLTTLTVDSKISKLFYFGGGLGFYQKGFEFDVQTFDENAQFTGTNKYALSYDYLGIPIFIGLRTNSKYSIIAETGIVPATLVNDQFKNKTTGQSGDLFNPKKFDLSVYGQYGIQRQVSELLAIKIAFSSYFSLNEIELFNYRHLTLNFHAGVSYQLKNR
jgi:hypothetical protein